jgi:hypothetical protein
MTKSRFEGAPMKDLRSIARALGGLEQLIDFAFWLEATRR